MYRYYIKHLLDFFVAFLLLPLLIIVCVFVTILIFFDDRGPTFYSAYRLGKNGKPFKMFKFRTMMVNAPDIRNEDGSTYNGEDDPRMTRLGRIMRKTSIDELPQIINILFGEMSFIGPRPDPLDDLDIYTSYEILKLKVRPGITGYSQAFYRNSVQQKEKFKNDVYYVENLSFIFDVKILFKTIFTVLSLKKVYNESS